MYKAELSASLLFYKAVIFCKIFQMSYNQTSRKISINAYERKEKIK